MVSTLTLRCFCLTVYISARKKYQQIINRAVTKFKGLAWLLYDQQFHCCAAYNLSQSWDKVNLNLWTVTFMGLARPHCNVCSSPYHAEDECPSAELNRKGPGWLASPRFWTRHGELALNGKNSFPSLFPVPCGIPFLPENTSNSGVTISRLYLL